MSHTLKGQVKGKGIRKHLGLNGGKAREGTVWGTLQMGRVGHPTTNPNWQAW